MLTIAGGIIIAVIFLAAPGFWIMAALIIGLLLIAGVLLILFFNWAGASGLWVVGGILLLAMLGNGGKEETKKSD